jgi:ethanolamine utilization microcompartment shell protein EutS
MRVLPFRYIPGDYYMICDVCGFKYRRSDMKERWDGHWTCLKDWEPRHPQDYVKGKEDQQAVPIARPDTTDFYNQVTLSADASEGDTTITVSSATNISDDDNIGITLDDGTIQWTYVNGTPVGNVVTLGEILDGDASSGNNVDIPGDSFADDITADDL